MIVVLVLGAGGSVYLSRLWFRRWFNPLSTYSALWGFCLITYELRLIQYYPISLTAWFYILVAWISLYVGAFTAFLVIGHGRFSGVPSTEHGLKLLRNALILVSAIGVIAVARQVQILTREFGDVLTAILSNGNDIYLGKLSGELAFFPYVAGGLYAGCTLAGIYTARLGKLTFVASVPVILLALNNAFSMVRAGVIMAAFLFLTAFLYTPRERKFKIKKWQSFAGVAVTVAVFFGGFLVVSTTRGLGVDFPGITPAMDRISEYFPFFPSVYSNLSATPVALSLYLSAPEERKNGSWGEYSFAPPLRVLAKTGLVDERPRYEEDYYTPVPVNTSTYLKNVDSDFGLPGIVCFPYILGFLMTFLVLSIEKVPKLTRLVLLSNLYLLILSSFAVNLMVLGDWYISVIGGYVVAAVIDYQLGRVRQVSTAVAN